MKKKVTIVVVIVLVIVLIAACVMWRIGGVETESALGDHQKYVYAYVSSIEGNEVTYMEVDESVAKAAEERRRQRRKMVPVRTVQVRVIKVMAAQIQQVRVIRMMAAQVLQVRVIRAAAQVQQVRVIRMMAAQVLQVKAIRAVVRVQTGINLVWEHHQGLMDRPVEVRHRRTWTAPRCRRAHRAACPI